MSLHQIPCNFDKLQCHKLSSHIYKMIIMSQVLWNVGIWDPMLEHNITVFSLHHSIFKAVLNFIWKGNTKQKRETRSKDVIFFPPLTAPFNFDFVRDTSSLLLSLILHLLGEKKKRNNKVVMRTSSWKATLVAWNTKLVSAKAVSSQDTFCWE